MNKIKEYRELRNLSQKDLAKLINKAPQTLSGWENQTHDPDLESLIILSEILNVSIDNLLGKTEHKIEIKKEDFEKIKTIKKLCDEIITKYKLEK